MRKFYKQADAKQVDGGWQVPLLAGDEAQAPRRSEVAPHALGRGASARAGSAVAWRTSDSMGTSVSSSFSILR